MDTDAKNSSRLRTDEEPSWRRYLELVYESRFENADSVTETLVMTLDDDGAWRMFNYLVRRV